MENTASPHSPTGFTSWLGVLARITLCTLVAAGGYALLCAKLLTPYVNEGSDAGRVVGVYEGYDRIAAAANRQRELVLFWGSSMIREGVDCDQLQAQDPGIDAYNLSVSGDLPSRRVVELPKVLALRPDRVVIGISYPEILETRLPFEDQIGALPSAAYREMPAAAHALLSDATRNIAGRSDFERAWWKRKFLLSATCWKLGIPDRSNPIPDGFVSNLKTPNVYTKSIARPELERFLTQRQGFYPPYTAGGASDPAHSPAAQSLDLLIRQLTAGGTHVVLAIMPLHPLLDEKIPASRRALLTQFARSYASPMVEIRDFESAFSADCFVDLLHLNERGRKAFTQAIAPSVASQSPANQKLVISSLK